MPNNKQNLTKSTGVLIPLFSLYSNRSVGIGDFEDLKLAVDWCEKTGNKILQLLPMNDSYNSIYAPFSLFALDSVYIALDRLIGVPMELISAEIEEMKELYPAGKRYVDYAVKVAKMELLYKTFCKLSPIDDEEFISFQSENIYWLQDYALFMTLKQEYSFEKWEEWDETYRDRESIVLEAFCEKHNSKVMFYKWLQWQLYMQFAQVKEYANSKNVEIMGDLFYMVRRDSADTWAKREYFMMNYVTGLPPEPSHEKGQRWGEQAVYNWDKIMDDDLEFVKKRLKYNEHFYNIIRLDHTPAFFRVWCIHKSEHWEKMGMNGFFYPSTYEEWEVRGRKILTTITESTNMALCAENLGPFTTFFTPVVRELGIPIINFQRWEKDWDNTHEYIKPKDYDFHTMIAISNHDTSNFADWWENEAGTVEASWFKSYCYYLNFDYDKIVPQLFEESKLNEKRLKWRMDINTVGELLKRVCRHEWQIEGLVKEYKNTFGEKEKLWEIMGLDGHVRERCDKEIITSAIKSVVFSNAVFCIDSIIDYLIAVGVVKQDYHMYRFNRPGVLDARDWSLVLPISLEELLNENICNQIQEILG
ncbi:4-alpha-glucanotransferase [Clostridium sp.]|uniref:4-alpha-glucanotransferase n=1 Tax=Clostridium sp. TaxID=1506 RepID=UPI0026225865|nr:4-alpha-glucanotransferase [Clostridium sp.]